jgi:hypothetical protein
VLETLSLLLLVLLENLLLLLIVFEVPLGLGKHVLDSGLMFIAFLVNEL